jgi:nitroreductase
VMDFAALRDMFQTRRSIRKWKPDAIPEELIVQAIEAAGYSPNSGGRQPYHCYVITNPVKIVEIAAAVQSVTDYLAALCRSDADLSAVERWRLNSGFFAQAPLLIAVSASIYQSISDKLQVENIEDPRVREINRCRQIASSRVQTVGAFVDHLLLGLHALGLGAVWMAGPTQAKKEVEAIVGMGENEDFIALIPVGYPDEQPVAPTRKPLSEIVSFIK